jgi:hypothetical protein
MKKIFLLVITAISIIGYSQNFNYKVELNKVDSTHYYKIQLSPKITSKLKADFSDIRLYNENNIEIPYIFQVENITNEKELFSEYKIISIEHFKRHSYTRIVIQNPNKTKINNIALRIKNADVRKHLKLNASYDNENWYVLKDNYYYNSINNSENTSEIRIMNFPFSDYEYYELLIGDYFDKPINITQAGYYNTIKENGKYTKIKDVEYSIEDTLKETIVKIITNGNYIDKIYFDIDSPKYYYRDAKVYVKKTEKRLKKINSYNKNIAYSKLISNSNNTVFFNNLNEDTIFIRIENKDNYPLQINDIKLFQLNKYLISELDSSNVYHLNYKNKNVKTPDYDLIHFIDKIPTDLQTISAKKPTKIDYKETDNNTNFNLSDYWLWIIVGVIAIVLFYMSYKMVKEKK